MVAESNTRWSRLRERPNLLAAILTTIIVIVTVVTLVVILFYA